ncbi:hypothetical protein VRRI112168_03695 [Vreelandella rituensis]|nr:hypothetical protein [Halomonas rituensis]
MLILFGLGLCSLIIMDGIRRVRAERTAPALNTLSPERADHTQTAHRVTPNPSEEPASATSDVPRHAKHASICRQAVETLPADGGAFIFSVVMDDDHSLNSFILQRMGSGLATYDDNLKGYHGASSMGHYFFTVFSAFNPGALPSPDQLQARDSLLVQGLTFIVPHRAIATDINPLQEAISLAFAGAVLGGKLMDDAHEPMTQEKLNALADEAWRVQAETKTVA